MKNRFKLLFLTLTLFTLWSYNYTPKTFGKSLKNYCHKITMEFNLIKVDRKAILNDIGEYILSKKKANEKVEILFVCTSNSRRSHLSQIWLQTAMQYYEIDKVSTYSGGTEDTEVNKRTIKALKECGFTIERDSNTYNSPYKVRTRKDAVPWIIFSKKYDHEKNPKNDFCTVMVCSEADRSCPIVPGADDRIGLSFDDPKRFDNTDTESVEYALTCQLIAREMFYIGNYVKNKTKK